MRRRLTWTAATSAAVLLTTLAPAGAAPGGLTRDITAGSSFAAGTAARATATAAAQRVILPTGDLIGLSADGRDTTLLARVSPGPLNSLRAGKATYVFPAALQRQVGPVLDPAMFDINRLAAAGARLPVTIRYASASSRTEVPGVEITSRSGTSARGVVTAASSRALGLALQHNSGAALFGHVASVQAYAPATNTPQWPMHTVTIKVIGHDGRPADALLGFFDPVNPERSSGVAFTTRGIAKISVPAGHLQLLNTDWNADYSEGYLVQTPELRIDGPSTVTLDMRTATTPIRTVTDRPIESSSTAVTELGRAFSWDGGSTGFSWSLIGQYSTRFLASPTVGSVHGTQSITQVVAGNSPTARPAYRYATSQTVSGRVPARAVVLRTGPGNLTRYQTSLRGPVDPATAGYTRGVLGPAGGWSIGMPPPARDFTEYVSTGPDLTHQAEFVQYQAFDPTFTLKGQFFGPPRPAPAAGRSLTEVWGGAPLHQRFNEPNAVNTTCPACLTDGGAAVGFIAAPLSDATHLGSSDVIEPDFMGHITIKADRTTLYDGLGDLTGAVELPGRTKVISTTAVSTRSGRPYPYPTVMTTASSVRTASAFPAPSTWQCLGETCAVLPMLSLDYSSAADRANVLPAGRQRIGLTVRQVGRAQAKGVTAVKAWTSTDGRTWTAVPVTGSGATYAASVTVPRAAGSTKSLSLKVSVADAAGSTLTEQIVGAFGLPR